MRLVPCDICGTDSYTGQCRHCCAGVLILALEHPVVRRTVPAAFALLGATAFFVAICAVVAMALA